MTVLKSNLKNILLVIILLLIIAVLGFIFIYSKPAATPLTQVQTQEKSNSLTGVIQSIKITNPTRQPMGMQVKIVLKHDNQTTSISADSKTLFAKYSNSSTLSTDNFRLAELKAGDKITIFSNDTSASEIYATKLNQYE